MPETKKLPCSWLSASPFGSQHDENRRQKARTESVVAQSLRPNAPTANDERVFGHSKRTDAGVEH